MARPLGKSVSNTVKSSSPISSRRRSTSASSSQPQTPRRAKSNQSLSKAIDKKRQNYNSNKLQTAIKDFFYAVDEDGNGYLEPHEFAVAQTVVAELAGSSFDADAADLYFKDTALFDANDDGRISLDEFTKTMVTICDVLPADKEDIMRELASKSAQVLTQTRREIAKQVRQFFVLLDVNSDGYLDETELQLMISVANDLLKELRKELGNWESVGKSLDMKAFDKSRDGKVEMTEFVDQFVDLLKIMKIPKKDILAKVKIMQEDAAKKIVSGSPMPSPNAGHFFQDRDHQEEVQNIFQTNEQTSLSSPG